jgi:hypothetical protein
MQTRTPPLPPGDYGVPHDTLLMATPPSIALQVSCPPLTQNSFPHVLMHAQVGFEAQSPSG